MGKDGFTGATELPDGTLVRGRGLGLPKPEGLDPDFGLYLGGPVLRRRHDASLGWEHEWINWPDGLLPTNRQLAADRIVALFERARTGQDVEIACHGGVGRTGTTMACLATLSGLSAEEAFTWTRQNYQRRAVETPWQRKWIGWFAANRTLKGSS
ncbi:protein tyrosine phosphatase [Prauserella marina]|uniref:Protein-tyrosine phosphatase n=1 Tax=Prauserella marina TaxID=530584 RepID=A0A222VYB5_9PSEU|nr:protein-tyrosine phosphatase family protein [Prauserella marina]ASR38701.1 protein tyrosine phosphatase [Prauserella marina]PWV82038.1 protein-tyrosine phosphatase [Prauserella marina]SDD18037.1 Protein-tyrosine phosphatase [Prauserella marina]